MSLDRRSTIIWKYLSKAWTNLYNLYKCTSLRVITSISLNMWAIQHHNPLYQTPHHHQLGPSIYIFYKFSMTNSIHACNLLIFARTTLQNSHSRNTWEINHLRVILSQQNDHVFMHNVIWKRMLLCNHLSNTTFKFYFKMAQLIRLNLILYFIEFWMMSFLGYFLPLKYKSF